MEKENNIESRKKETITWAQMCFVRAIVDPSNQLKPVNGELISVSPINSSQGEIPRFTVHYAINHLVADNLGGRWGRSRLVILSPGDKMVDKNGVPNNLNAVDTFWAKDVIIPKGSVLLWFGSEPTQDLLNVDGIENKFIDIPDGLEESLSESIIKYEECKKSLEEKKILYPEYQQAEAQVLILSKKIKEIMDEVTNQELLRLGYEIFRGDHGEYMDGPMAGPIEDLAEKEGITSAIHVYTLMGEIEMGNTYWIQPLMQLARESDRDMFKVDKDGRTDFLDILSYLTKALTDHKVDSIDLSEGQEKQLLVLATELYNRTRSNEHLLSRKTVSCLRMLLNSSRLIKENWRAWDREFVDYIDHPKKNNMWRW